MFSEGLITVIRRGFLLRFRRKYCVKIDDPCKILILTEMLSWRIRAFSVLAMKKTQVASYIG